MTHEVTRDGGSQARRQASGRFRRTPATGPLQEARRAWGIRWGAVNSALAAQLRTRGV